MCVCVYVCIYAELLTIPIDYNAINNAYTKTQKYCNNQYQ